MNFDLHRLGWKAFQDLCATVLSEVLGQTLQQYFDSHDGGRDGAFAGIWHPQKDEVLHGPFTAQCKFTAKSDKQLSLKDLAEELDKARRLAAKGLATTYLLMTNCRLTGTVDEQLRTAFLAIPGIRHFAAYGSEWLCGKIQESSRLRMLVPRIYGLGDLSQILDERAYNQTQEILSTLGDDLSRFVITEAHRKSTRALVEHGFVLLLGEAASGKSTIAAALSVASIDEWGCRTLKVRSADEFVRHFNSNEKQLFWVDDAFGPTQFDHSLATQWNHALSHMKAALNCGSRIVFTSRDYIYNAAIDVLKTSGFPLFSESQVIIKVEELSLAEREQILYNHVKLGRQPKSFRVAIKPHLPLIAANQSFRPETARRLSDPVFTKNLSLSRAALDDFVTRPVEHLIEVIRTLDSGSRAALGVVFMHGGSLPSPLTLTADEEGAVKLMGSGISDVRKSLTTLKESLVLKVYEEGQYQWRFKHPTIRDAFASLVAEDLELLDIYLAGSSPERLISEVSCGDMGIQGVKVIIPSGRYQTVIDRLDQGTGWDFRWKLYSFLAARCDKRFLELYIACHPDFLSKLYVYSYLDADPDVDVLYRLHKCGLLPEEVRMGAAIKIERLAIETPDAGFLSMRVRSLLTDDEFASIIGRVRTELVDDLSSTISNWRDTYTYDENKDPEDYFDPLRESLRRFQDELDGDADAVASLSKAIESIDAVVEELRESTPGEQEDYDYDGSSLPSRRDPSRSIFDDIDQ